MDQRERYESYEEAIRVALQGLQSNIWTALPGIIQSFDANKQTATVQFAVKLKQYTDDATTIDYQLPLLADVPVQFPQGGAFCFTFPIAQGDECLIVFSSRSIDNWFASGKVSSQTDMRMHSHSDGFALMGFRSTPRAVAAYNTDSARLRLNDNSAYFELTAGGAFNVVAPGGINFTAPNLAATIATKTTWASPTIAATGLVQLTGSLLATGGVRSTVTPVTFTGGIGIDTHHHTQGNDSAGNTEQPTSIGIG